MHFIQNTSLALPRTLPDGVQKYVTLTMFNNNEAKKVVYLTFSRGEW